MSSKTWSHGDADFENMDSEPDAAVDVAGDVR